MRRALPILLLLAAPAFAFGQAPAPPAPVAKAVAASKPAYPSGSVVYVDATGSSTGWPLQFQVVGRPNEPKATLDGGTGVIYPALPDGVYFVAVSASAPVDGKPPAIDTAVVSVTVGATPNPPPSPPPPTPTPQPVPVPPPPPSPVALARPAYVTLVYDSGAAPGAIQSLAPIKGSTSLPTSVLGLNARWLTLDAQNAGEYSRRNLARAVAAAGGPPCLVVQGSPATPGGPSVATGYALPSPATEASVLSFLKTIVGGN